MSVERVGLVSAAVVINPISTQIALTPCLIIIDSPLPNIRNS